MKRAKKTRPVFFLATAIWGAYGPAIRNYALKKNGKVIHWRRAQL